MAAESEEVEASVRRWLAKVVIGMNLCPFAARELENNRVRFAVSRAKTEERLLADLSAELRLIASNAEIETTLVIHPDVLRDFAEYNQFLDVVDLLLAQSGSEGIFQVASFHPDYCFAGTGQDDAENYSNRSPHPILHILREDSLETAIASHPDTAGIPGRNIKRLNALGQDRLRALLKDCLRPSSEPSA